MSGPPPNPPAWGESAPRQSGPGPGAPGSAPPTAAPPPPGPGPEAAPGAPPDRRVRVRAGAVVAVAVAVGIVVWLIVRGGGGTTKHPTSTPAPQRAAPVAASVVQLRALAGRTTHPLYWLGPKPGDTYELTQTSDAKVYVRYLPAGVPLGVNVPNYMTVATYPSPDGFATVTQASKLSGEWIHHLRRGGLAVASPRLPKSVYLSYPGAKFLVEVYDPTPSHARVLVTTGQVRPIPHP